MSDAYWHARREACRDVVAQFEDQARRLARENEELRDEIARLREALRVLDR